MALYRKYRPETFEDFVNQEHVVKALQNAIERDSLSHSYIFSGPRGTGKTSMARVLANALNVSDLDLIEIDGATYTGVDKIREIIDKVQVSPSQSLYKIYVIDEVHMLSNSAFNALLKTLEEPPEHVIFVLVTTEPHKIPLTVKSRCQRFDFKKLKPEEITGRLMEVAERESIDLSEDVARVITQSATGSLRDSLSHLEQLLAFGVEELTPKSAAQLLGVVDQAKVEQLTELLLEKQGREALELVEELYQKGYDPSNLVRSWSQYFHDLLFQKINGDAGELADRFSVESLTTLLRRMVQLETRVEESAVPTAPIEVFILDWVGERGLTDRSDSGDNQISGDSQTNDQKASQSEEEKEPDSAAKEVQTDDSPSSSQSDNAQTNQQEDTGSEKQPDTLKGKWQKVAAAVKAKKPSLASVLQQAQVRLQNDEIYIAVSSDFFRQQLKKTENMQKVFDACKDAFQGDYKIEIEVDQDLTPTLDSDPDQDDSLDIEEVSKVFG